MQDIQRLGIKTIAIPPLGAGLGGLDWELVREKIQAAMAMLPDTHILVYEPKGAPENDRKLSKLKHLR